MPSQRELVSELRALGVQPGGVLMVHTAFSKVGPLEGGPLGLIEALRDAVGSEGTLVMPSMSDDDDQPFDPAKARCRSMGIVADTFWRLPGVRRSPSPHGFAAEGPRAEEIAADQPIEVPHGPDSPVGRVHALDGQVLLLGVGQDANTTIHLAEELAGVLYRRPGYATVLEGGKPRRRQYTEPDHCCGGFALMDGWLQTQGRQQQGRVGRGSARLARSRHIVEAALEHLRVDPLVFLHPPGTDAECDAARAIAVATAAASLR